MISPFEVLGSRYPQESAAVPSLRLIAVEG